MIYQELEKLLQSLGDKSELWDKLNQAVLDLADKNLNYLTISIGVLFAIIGIPTIYANYQIKKERKEIEDLNKKLESKFEEYENKFEENQKCLDGEVEELENAKVKLEKQEEGIEEIKNSLLYQNKKTEKQTSQIEGLRKDVESFLQSGRGQAAGFEKEFDKQKVEIKRESYLNSILIENQLLGFFTLKDYILSECIFWKKHSSFVAVKNIGKLLENIESNINSAVSSKIYTGQYHKILTESLIELSKIPEFKVATDKLIQKSKNSITDPSFDLPSQKTEN